MLFRGVGASRDHHIIDLGVLGEAPFVHDRVEADALRVADHHAGAFERGFNFGRFDELIEFMRAAREPAEHVFCADNSEGVGFGCAVDCGDNHQAAGLYEAGALGEELRRISDVFDDIEV